MKITFLGTRGYIDSRTRRHYRHTITMIEYKRTRLLIDAGLDWRGKIAQCKPDAIIITHAHPDHAWALKEGAPCPVYATQESWHVMEKYPIVDKHVVFDRKLFKIKAIHCEPFAVEHSIRAPAVGYRIMAGNVIIFCVHDLISIHDRHDALQNIRLYIGDGATIVRPIIRRKGDILFGHTTIRTQLSWCEKEGVKRAIFTHCGSEIVEGNTRMIEGKIHMLGAKKGVDASIAYDGKSIILR